MSQYFSLVYTDSEMFTCVPVFFSLIYIDSEVFTCVPVFSPFVYTDSEVFGASSRSHSTGPV